jgi:hypothetical protein
MAQFSRFSQGIGFGQDQQNQQKEMFSRDTSGRVSIGPSLPKSNEIGCNCVPPPGAVP